MVRTGSGFKIPFDSLPGWSPLPQKTASITALEGCPTLQLKGFAIASTHRGRFALKSQPCVMTALIIRLPD